MNKNNLLSITKIIFTVLMIIGILGIASGCVLFVALSKSDNTVLSVVVPTSILGGGAILMIVSTMYISRANINEGSDINFSTTYSGVNMYRVFGEKAYCEHTKEMEEYFSSNTVQSLEIFSDISIFKNQLDNIKNNQPLHPYFCTLCDNIGSKSDREKLETLHNFYGVAIRIMSGMYKHKLFDSDIYSTSPLLGENIAEFKNAVKVGKLSIDDRILLFYFAYHNKQFKEEMLVKAFNEFVCVYTHQGDTLEHSSIITARFAKDNSVFKPINPLFSVNQLELMSESELDSFIENMFIGLGYTTIHTLSTDNSPIDFIIEKDGNKLSVMAKSYGLIFDEKQITTLASEIAKCNTERGILITTNTISNDAILLAEKLGIEIYSIDKLEKLINGLKKVNKNRH